MCMCEAGGIRRECGGPSGLVYSRFAPFGVLQMAWPNAATTGPKPYCTVGDAGMPSITQPG